MAKIHQVRKYLLIFLIQNFFCSHVITEKEPENNIRKQAVKLDPGKKLSGSFYTPTETDIDYLYVTVDSPAMIKGELTAVKGVDSEILFYHKSEAAPFKIINDNKSSLNEKFGPFLISSPGVVIAIRPNASVKEEKYAKLKYEFMYELTTAPMPMEIEPNDSIIQANPFEGDLIHGFYNNALSGDDIEKDYYAVDIPDKQKYRLSAKLSGIDGIDSVLRLFSKEGEKLLTIDNASSGGKENIYSYGVQGPTTLYLSVNSKDYKISNMEYYELEISVDPYDEKFELEPNDSFREATPIKVSKIFSDFANDHDVDYYRFYNETFDTLSFSAEVVPGSNFDIRLDLYSGINSTSTVFDDGGDDMSEGISNWTIKPLETLYLKVNKKSQGKTGSYTLNTASVSFTENQEREPNNSMKVATILEPEKSITGYINPVKDIDYFKIKIPVQNKYIIELESPIEAAMTISILDQKGIKTDSKSASQQGKNISFETILDPESFIMLNCENTTKPLYKNTYRLRITASE